jgi:hypothetical protein
VFDFEDGIESALKSLMVLFSFAAWATTAGGLRTARELFAAFRLR